jgi:hypothetical protein
MVPDGYRTRCSFISVYRRWACKWNLTLAIGTLSDLKTVWIDGRVKSTSSHRRTSYSRHASPR